MVSIKDVALIGGLGVLVFLVTRAGRDLAGVLGNLKLPDFNFPGIGDISFPDFDFPDFFPPQQPAANTVPNPPPVVLIPNDPMNPDAGAVLAPPPLTINPNPNIPIEIGGGGAGGFQINPETFETQSDLFQQAASFFGGASQIPQNILASITQFFTGGLIPQAGAETQPDFTGTTVIEPIGNQPTNIESLIPQMQQLENNNVQSQIPDQQFFGGGASFIGGTVNTTPIEFLSLNQIIEMGLAESATGAANLRAIAQGFTPEEEAFLNQPGTIGSEQNQIFNNAPGQFQGLTPEQIALQLTGGVISNF